MNTIILILAIFMNVVSYASQANDYVTQIDQMDVDNGLAWLNLDRTSKTAYVKGLSFGITRGAGTILKSLNLTSIKDNNSANQALDEIIPRANYVEIVNYIDEFYKNSEYKIVPILDVYSVMAYEQRGIIKDGQRDQFVKKLIDNYKLKRN